MTTLTRDHRFVAFLVTSGALFYLVSFYSGYGYDAPEYLVVGRSLLEGHPFYTFIPSKSWGLYYVVAAFLAGGPFSSRAGVAALITVIYVLVCLTTFLVVERRFNRRTAWMATILVALCAPFMELNYLEPEGLVYVCGLLGFHRAVGAWKGNRGRDWVLAGVWFGVGMAFKAVAAFYLAGVLLCLLGRALLTGRERRSGHLRAPALLLLGAGAALLIPMAFFAWTGGLGEHLWWSYGFPLLAYPSNLAWEHKLYTKLLWFDVLLATAVFLSLRPSVRKAVYTDAASWLALAMGLTALIPLLKTQASHYAFPGAAFLSIFAASVVNRWWAVARMGSRRVLAGAAPLACCLIASSVALYQPWVLERVTQDTERAREERLQEGLKDLAGEEGRALFFRRSTLLYWLTGRYPNVPFLNTDVQALFVLRRDPGILVEALEDPRLALVEFDPEWPAVDDRRFLERDGNRALIRAFQERLELCFVPAGIDVEPFVFWVRKDPRPERCSAAV